ncbi:unnamed protein product [Urochloa humidicola]
MGTMHKEGAKTISHEGLDGSTMFEWDPWNPPRPPRRPVPPNTDMNTRIKLMCEWIYKKDELIATARATNIITPDRTPEWVNDAFYGILPRLVPILEKDSVRRFLSLASQDGRGMGWGFIITPQTFTQMMMHNALRCAKVALEGKAPELHGFRANPNCMNRFGYFPLHQAAEMFSVDMIKLLFDYNASANVRTAGAEVNENPLPLHVAVENTCLHKYLEDNAFPNQEDLDSDCANNNYVCKLIHLLCLPEMKIFLDTIRLLAKRTDNLVDELWYYIKDGKLVQTAVLLLAAQKHIRTGTCYKGNGNDTPDGFAITINRIWNHAITLESKNDEGLEMEKKLTRISLMLVRAVSQAGEVLDGYIQSYPVVPHNMQVPHEEVHERVSSILRDYGFCPNGEGISIGNLRRYTDVLSKEESPYKHGDMDAIMAAKGTLCQNAEVKKAVRSKAPRGWELKYARRSFFPYWRSVLAARLPVKVIRGTDVPTLVEQHQTSWNKSVGQESSPTPDLNPSLLAVRQFRGQPSRTFCSAALPLLKVLRNA